MGKPLVTSFSSQQVGEDISSSVTAQASDGTLYFGCKELLSYDGERWKVHPVPGSHVIRGVALSPDETRLWVGGMNEVGYFDRKNGDLSEYHSLRGKLPDGTKELGDVWYAFAQKNGAIFISSDRVFFWNGSDFSIWNMAGGTRLYACRLDDKIFVQNTETGLWSIDESGPKLFLAHDKAGSRGIGWLEKTKDGLLLGRGDGLFLLNDGELSPFAPSANAFIQKGSITAACRLPTGELCLGTLKGGLGIINRTGTLDRVLTVADGLPTRQVSGLFVDSSNALWVTSSTYIYRIRLDGVITVFDHDNGLRGRPIKSITEYQGSVFALTNEGVFSAPRTAAGTSQFSAAQEFSNQYRRLWGEGALIFASGSRALEIFDGQLVKSFIPRRNDVYLVAPSRTANTYLVLEANSISQMAYSPNEAPDIQLIGELPDTPTAVVEDDEKGIWVSTYSRGVTYFPNSGDSMQPRSTSILPIHVFSLVAQVRGKVVTLSDEGLAVRNTGTIVDKTTILSGYRPLAVSNNDEKGDIWVALRSPFQGGATSAVLGKLSLDKNLQCFWIPYSVEGLSDLGEVSCLYLDRAGTLWVGGDTAMARIEVGLLKPQSNPERPVLRANILPNEGLANQTGALRFEFSAMEFGHRSAIRYQTRLVGSAKEWSPPTNESAITFNSLRDGSYRFEVRTITDGGKVSEEASWNFTVLPPWYRTKEAAAGFALLTILGGYGMAQWRVRVVRRRNEELENLVKKKTLQLEHANAAKTEFVANMSHEIRNPISGIVGLVTAFEETQMDSRQQKITDSIRACAGLLATLVDDVLDFAKIEAGEIELKPAPFSILTLIEQCISMYEEEARRTDSPLKIEIADSLPLRLMGDTSRIQQIIINFLGNALKFGKGKDIVIGSSWDIQGRVRFYVTDHGAGMSAEDAATLFTKFTRLKSARDKNIKGTGLGLSVCRLLAAKMGGAVGVESKLGEGSTFWVALPLTTATHSETKQVGSVPLSGKSLRALLVEDLEYNAMAMQAVLRRAGLDAEVAIDGPIALEMLRKGIYDVVFMDWDLPGMNGAEVTRRFREVESPNRRALILATTAHSTAATRQACLAAGMDGFITKPLTPEKIVRALNDLGLSRRASPSVEIQTGEDRAEYRFGLDLQLLRFLADDSKENLSVQIDRFLLSFEEARQKAREAVNRQAQPADIYRVGHKLLSHAKMIGASTLSELALQVQEGARGLNPRQIGSVLDQFDQEYAEVRYKLESIRVSQAPV